MKDPKLFLTIVEKWATVHDLLKILRLAGQINNQDYYRLVVWACNEEIAELNRLPVILD